MLDKTKSESKLIVTKEFERLNEEQFHEENRKLAIVPLRIIALITVIVGLAALVIEVRYFREFSVEIYYGRIISTVIAFIISVAANFGVGKKHPFLLIHILLLCIIGSFGSVIFLVPKTLVINSQILSLVIFIVALFLNWEVKHQIVVAIYYNVVFAASILLNDQSVYFLPNIFETVLFVMFISLMAVVASSINYKLKKQAIFNALLSSTLEKKYRSIIENSVDGIFQVNLEGIFITMNPALKKILGFDEDDILNELSFKDIFRYSEDLKQLEAILERNGKIKNYRTLFKKPNGSEVNVKMNVMLVNNEYGTLSYYEGSVQDITLQVVAEKERNEAIEELRKAKKSSDINAKKALSASHFKTQFLSKMNHEIRTPVNSVLGILSLIHDNQFQTTEELKKYSKDAKDSVENLLDIINTTFDLSKIDAGKMEVDEVEFNIRNEVDRAVSQFSNSVNPGVKLHYKIDSKVPDFVIGDSIKFRQILVNLIGNSLKFTSEGEVLLDLTLGKTTNSKIELIAFVKDSGSGIAPDKLPQIFEPYAQIRTDSSKKMGGAGLGLTICRELIHLMGGKISVKSKEGQGTIFLFTVIFKRSDKIAETNIAETDKMHQIEETEAKAETATVDEQESNDKFEKVEVKVEKSKTIEENEEAVATGSEKIKTDEKIILLVEDNEVNKNVEMKILKQLGYKVEAVSSGPDAIEAVKSLRYNLVLMDVEMSDMDGITATHKIRELDGDISEIPIIAVTAHSSMKYREQCINGGMNDFVAKPINAQFLKMIIDEWLYKI